MSRVRNTGGTVISIWQRDKRVCWICRHRVALADASRDHVKPRGIGGYDKARNYRLAHKVCNAARQRLPEHLVERVRTRLGRDASVVQYCDALRAEYRRYVKEGK